MKQLSILTAIAIGFVCLCIFQPMPEVTATPISTVSFSIASSAATSAPNLRIQTMTKKLANSNGTWVQGFSPDGATLNYYLTKNQSVTTSGYAAIKVQADQDTKMKINGESSYYTLFGGVDYTYVIHD